MYSRPAPTAPAPLPPVHCTTPLPALSPPPLRPLQFIEGLRHVALHHRLALNEVMERLVAVGGPRAGA